MDTSIDTGTLAIYQAASEANTKIAILRRVVMDSRDAVPVRTICQIFDWKIPRQESKKPLNKAKIIELRKGGKSARQIAEMVGTDEYTVLEVLKAGGLSGNTTTI